MEGHALNEHKEVLLNRIISKFLLAVYAQACYSTGDAFGVLQDSITTLNLDLIYRNNTEN